jgi:16S rRNA (guanine527-N7)-methyltransferase
MDPGRIAEHLAPFLSTPLSPEQLEDISMYINILLRWNQKLNLTAVRDLEHIVTRHFGESVFAAQNLSLVLPGAPESSGARLLDVGSGAGFPGLPIKICVPELAVTLIESNHKKATFLREVIRALTLTHIDVFTGRAQDLPASSAHIVTLRAVERFDTTLLAAARLLRPSGRLALLIGQSQVSRTASLLPRFIWRDPLLIPLSRASVLLIGGSKTPESPMPRT